MTSPLQQALEEFQRAQAAYRKDAHDAEHAQALRRARLRLDEEVERVRRRLPFGVRIAGAGGHLVTGKQVQLREGLRYRGQTLCGALPGRPVRGQPAPCGRCLRVADRYLTEGPPPLELEL